MAELNLDESYVTDSEGRRIGVLLSLSAYEALMQRLNELQAFRSANEVSMEDVFSSDLINEDIPQRFMPTNPRRGPGGMIII